MPTRYDLTLVTDGTDRQDLRAWLREHNERVTAVSRVEGCRCCVDLLSLEVEDGVPAPPRAKQVDTSRYPLQREAELPAALDTLYDELG